MRMSCLFCGVPMRGRSDKKFCGGHCRASFHNQKNRKLYQQLRHINAVLRHNRKVLVAWGDSSICKPELLIQSGFNFHYYTHTLPRAEGNIGYCCYDIGYEFSDGGEIRIFSCNPPPLQLAIREGGDSVLALPMPKEPDEKAED